MTPYLRLAFAVTLCGTLTSRASAAPPDAKAAAPADAGTPAPPDPASAAAPDPPAPTRDAPAQEPLAPPLLPAAPTPSFVSAPHTIVPQEPQHEVRWDPRWRKFDLINLVPLSIGGAAAFGTLAIPPDEGRWVNGNDFDVAARDALRFHRQTDRNRARDASDIMLVMSINQVLVDTLVVAWWGHGNEEVAWQMALISAETLAINAGINGLVSALTSRERPYREQCVGELNEQWSDCRTNKRYRSFYSGHTSTAFAMAGLTCMHHAHLPLYGGGAGDKVVCATSFGIAAATGAMRVAADQHWSSDVLVGAATGTLTGLTIPWLLHYRTNSMPAAPDGISAQLVPTGTGATLVGTF